MKKELQPGTNLFLQILLGVLLFVFFLSAAVTLTLNCRALYRHDIRALGLAQSTGMSEENILRQYDALITYNNIGGPDKLVFPSLPSSETGLIHFAEVKSIFLFFEWTAIITFVLSAAGVWFLRKQRPRKYLKYAAVVSLAVPAVVGLLAALFWRQFFTIFHEIFFRNDYWIFSYETDPIIGLLPDTYFFHCAIMIVAVILFCGLVCLGLYLWRERKYVWKKKDARIVNSKK